MPQKWSSIKETEHAHEPLQFKARLCGKGFLQQHGIDFNDTYAPVAAYCAVRLLVTLMCKLDYEIDCVDIITAFLHSPLKEEVYIKIPDGWPVPTGKEN